MRWERRSGSRGAAEEGRRRQGTGESRPTESAETDRGAGKGEGKGTYGSRGVGRVVGEERGGRPTKRAEGQERSDQTEGGPVHDAKGE